MVLDYHAHNDTDFIYDTALITGVIEVHIVNVMIYEESRLVKRDYCGNFFVQWNFDLVFTQSGNVICNQIKLTTIIPFYYIDIHTRILKFGPESESCICNITVTKTSPP